MRRPRTRAMVDLLLAIMLVVAAPMRTLCYDSCVSEAEASSVATPADAACHDSDDASPPSQGEPSEEDCRHRDKTPAQSLRAIHKPDDVWGGARDVVHHVAEVLRDATPVVSDDAIPRVTLHAASSPLHAPPPLRL